MERAVLHPSSQEVSHVPWEPQHTLLMEPQCVAFTHRCPVSDPSQSRGDAVMCTHMLLNAGRTALELVCEREAWELQVRETIHHEAECLSHSSG